ncbi:unnamed protein product [Rotaria sordida]|uniref:mitogen-activated protein kinase kinase n=1 Tax=Rotaria sordida TaxID=392033 RepID=A0A815RL20_9BILA|nr:unnamed protein product [Rotaria sordida]
MISMELMDTSFDHFYKFVYHKLDLFIPESVLAYITLITLEAMDYLRSRWNIIHQSVKPSNILVSRTAIKLVNSGITNKIFDMNHAIINGSDFRSCTQIPNPNPNPIHKPNTKSKSHTPIPNPNPNPNPIHKPNTKSKSHTPIPNPNPNPNPKSQT